MWPQRVVDKEGTGQWDCIHTSYVCALYKRQTTVEQWGALFKVIRHYDFYEDHGKRYFQWVRDRVTMVGWHCSNCLYQKC